MEVLHFLWRSSYAHETPETAQYLVFLCISYLLFLLLPSFNMTSQDIWLNTLYPDMHNKWPENVQWSDVIISTAYVDMLHPCMYNRISTYGNCTLVVLYYYSWSSWECIWASELHINCLLCSCNDSYVLCLWCRQSNYCFLRSLSHQNGLPVVKCLSSG